MATFPQMLQEQLLLQLTHHGDGVALAALDYWQEGYLEPLMGLPPEVRQGALHQQQTTLQALTRAVVRRTQLAPEVAATATADARDLPEETRMVSGGLGFRVYGLGFRV